MHKLQTVYSQIFMLDFPQFIDFINLLQDDSINFCNAHSQWHSKGGTSRGTRPEVQALGAH